MYGISHLVVNVGKYTSPMDGMGMQIYGNFEGFPLNGALFGLVI